MRCCGLATCRRTGLYPCSNAEGADRCGGLGVLGLVWSTRDRVWRGMELTAELENKSESATSSSFVKIFAGRDIPRHTRVCVLELDPMCLGRLESSERMRLATQTSTLQTESHSFLEPWANPRGSTAWRYSSSGSECNIVSTSV